MITARFFTRPGRVTGFEVKGHAGLAPSGADILCAAVTSAVRLTECAVNDVLGAGAAVKVNQRTGAITLTLPGDAGAEADSVCQTLLTALMVYLTDLGGEYPEHLIVLDTEV